MTSKDQTPNAEESIQELDLESTPSVDDFIRELEAKEKDLHITADLMIELSDADDEPALPAFMETEFSAPASAERRGMPSQPSGGTKTRLYELEQEVEILKDRIEGLRADRKEIQEKSDRRLKDFENYKYRMDRERRGAFIEQIANLASQMLPVLDNLDRALVSVKQVTAKKSPEFQQFLDGIVLVNQQVNETFANMGVEPIATVGERFDPNFHEAVATVEDDSVPTNTVSEEMLRGYRIGNRVIRHSMVKVTTAPPKKAGSAEDAAARASSAAPDQHAADDDNAPAAGEAVPTDELPETAED